VATRDGCYALVERAVARLGGLDILVNSAGIGESGPFAEVGEDLWDATIAINLKGTFFCCQAALPHLKASHGNIVNLASDAGLVGEAGLSAYCTSKGGVVNLTRALALELAPEVRVNCVCPGYTDTDMVRRDGIDRADDPAAAERAVLNYAPCSAWPSRARSAAPSPIWRARMPSSLPALRCRSMAARPLAKQVRSPKRDYPCRSRRAR
jgi:NAD(P)-dependent dehydrogenase (short-subunit alcohol dehydrogenase family)